MDARTLEKQRIFFSEGNTRSYDFRIAQLKKLKALIQENESAFCEALQKDLGKHSTEAKFTEIRFIIKEIDIAIAGLKSWMKPQSVSTPFILFPGSSYIQPEPLGCVFIIGPWNYPFQLVMGPLIGAIAAGNCAMIKPSELTKHTTTLILKLINENFSDDYLHAIDIMPEDMAAVLAHKFDHIFFTGGTRVAKIISRAAAEHLTPVTLELGGKSPCIVDETANLDYAARRIIFAKMMNAGQTCIAPDYVYVHESIKTELLEKLTQVIQQFYSANPEDSKSFGRIISEGHFNRLESLLAGAQIVAGGQCNRDSLYVAPTIVDNVSWDDPVMQEEIFGPILPILAYQDIHDLVRTLASKPKSLALYLFSKYHPTVTLVMNNVSFGGGCVNDCLMQAVNPDLPFGGVGNSGFGAYHGKASFDTFTHGKSIYKRNLAFDPSIMYPPYSDEKEKWLSYLM